MSTSAVKKIHHPTLYTYADYATWPEQPRFELIKGEAIEMSAPSEAHQTVSVALTLQFGGFLRGKECRLYHAPFDVRINHATGDNTVVQPDLVIVCDRSKVENGKHCLGAPDMVIEIHNSTWGTDMLKKFNIYLEAGVGEYWIVNPDDKTVAVHILENEKYFTKYYGEADKIPVHTLQGCTVNLAEVFEGMLTENETPPA